MHLESNFGDRLFQTFVPNLKRQKVTLTEENYHNFDIIRLTAWPLLSNLDDETNNVHVMGCRHSSVDLFALFILPPQV